ncbi:MAG TPA: GTPase ObgE [Planctomycetes bacterium]|nr:GTPase ObgE [Planctomycetota bacterium]
MFIDEAEILVKAGRGGDGCVAFLHEKYRPRGGPAGGDGGRGADVVLLADRDTGTLWELARQRQFAAENGRPGQGKKRSGKSGRPLLLKVPLGTIVRERREGPVLFDLTAHGQRVVVAAGGKGGRGNVHFATSTDRAPRRAEHGADGEEKLLYLELRLIADVGLVGLPNAGKSTLISRFSAAHPKVADYPFTTRTPELGVVQGPDYKTIVLADLPGLIQGAHGGAGLGHAFLRHIERTRLIAHLVELAPPASAPIDNYMAVRNELALHSRELACRPEIIVLTKADLDPDGSAAQTFAKALAALADNPAHGLPLPPRPPNFAPFYVAISALTGYNIQKLFGALFDAVSRLDAPEMK